MPGGNRYIVQCARCGASVVGRNEPYKKDYSYPNDLQAAQAALVVTAICTMCGCTYSIVRQRKTSRQRSAVIALNQSSCPLSGNSTNSAPGCRRVSRFACQ